MQRPVGHPELFPYSECRELARSDQPVYDRRFHIPLCLITYLLNRTSIGTPKVDAIFIRVPGSGHARPFLR